MPYEKTKLRTVIKVGSIVSVHYFEYSANYAFVGESHDFWEFVYVDRGSVVITAGDEEHILTKDQIAFHKPGEFHSLRSEGNTPNLVVIAFECDSNAMRFFEDKVLRVNPDMRINLQHIVREAKHAFSSDLNNPLLTKLERREEVPFGCEQMIKLFLELFLIELHRRNSHAASASTQLNAGWQFVPTVKCNEDNPVFSLIVDYMERHIGLQLTLNDVCRDNLISRSAAQKLFRQITGNGVMDYFAEMKIQYAKLLIREQKMNFTQIANALGYSSIHYLSRHFKQRTGMTLTEFSRSVL